MGSDPETEKQFTKKNLFVLTDLNLYLATLEETTLWRRCFVIQFPQSGVVFFLTHPYIGSSTAPLCAPNVQDWFALCGHKIFHLIAQFRDVESYSYHCVVFNPKHQSSSSPPDQLSDLKSLSRSSSAGHSSGTSGTSAAAGAELLLALALAFFFGCSLASALRFSAATPGRNVWFGVTS